MMFDLLINSMEKVPMILSWVFSKVASINVGQVQERFEVDIKELPEQIDTSTYSKF